MAESMETRGLGAGSYPEAPGMPEGGAVCEKCGWHRGLKEADGMILCRECRAEYYRCVCQGEYWGFLNHSREEQRRFFLEFWFDELPDEEKIRLAGEAFRREYDSPLPQKQNEKAGIIQEYIKDNPGEFADYVEGRDGAA